MQTQGGLGIRSTFIMIAPMLATPGESVLQEKYRHFRLLR